MAQLSGGTTIAGYEAMHAGNIVDVMQYTFYTNKSNNGYIDFFAEGAGDLVIPLGYYATGTHLNITVSANGGWAEGGASFTIDKPYGNNYIEAKSDTYSGIARGGNTEFYYYGGDGYMYLFFKWINTSPNKASVNTLKLRVFHTNTANPNDQGNFSSATKFNYIFPNPIDIGNYSVAKLNKDSNGIYTTVQYKRIDGTLAMQSILSGGTSPKYTTRTEHHYDNKWNLLYSLNYALAYDSDGDVLSETIV